MDRKEKVIKFIQKNLNKTQLYRNLYNKLKCNDITEIQDVPVISKNNLIHDALNVLSFDYFGDYYSGKLKTFFTSGSTGEAYRVFWDERDNMRSLLELYYLRNRYYGIRPENKMCYFYPSDIEIEDIFQENNALGISKAYLYNDKIQEAYIHILNYNPVWMILQPGIAMILCDVIERYNYPVPDNLRYVELTGEYLSKEMRSRIQNVFKCVVANQYGMKEFNSIAYECPEGRLHCLESNVYVEILDDEDIYVTTLKNNAMPLIRFKTGDKGILRKCNCACGKTGYELELKAGRCDDYLLNKNGKKIHAYSLIQIIQNINYMYDGIIIQYQILQKSLETIMFRVVPKYKGDEHMIFELIHDRMFQRFGNWFKVEIQFCDFIEIHGKNKVAVFISQI